MSNYERIAALIRHLEVNRLEQPSLRDLADVAGLSPYHLQRLFSQWVGLSPKSFLQQLTLHDAKSRLLSGQSVLQAALDAGLSGPGRLHDLCITLEAASPGEIKSGGDGWSIRAGFADSVLGHCLVAEGPRGICHLSFLPAADTLVGESLIRDDWPRARIRWDDEIATRVVAQALGGASTQPGGERVRLRCFVRGTDFQVRVWRALLQIPYGRLASYGQVAAAIGAPRAGRAVGSAVGRNAIGVLIPCHRVIRETGVITQYRWGAHRKRALIALESSEATPRWSSSA